MIDGIAAAQWLLNYGSVLGSRCLYYVWLAYKAFGASTSMGAPNAYLAWQMSDGKRPGDRNPPAGAAVWWGRRNRDGNMDGDVTISLGGGRVAVTEPPNQGYVTGSCTLDERENEIDREYLGWTSSIFDCPINVSAGKDAAPTPTTAIPSEEDDMLMLSIAAAGGKHLAALGVGVFRHFVPSDPVEWIKNVSRSDDTWVDVSLSDLPALLRTYGCDLRIWDVRDGSLVILDPLDGSVQPGNMWSAVNALRATVTPIAVTSAETAAYLKGLTAPKA